MDALVAHVEQEKTAVGNTKTTAYKSRNWFFTWNNYTKSDIDKILLYLAQKHNVLYVFQEEIGKNGTIHLQGCFKFKNAIHFDSLKNEFPSMHLEKVISWKDSVRYCSKGETRNGLCYSNIPIPEVIIDFFDLEKATKWQLDIINLVNSKPDLRKVYWYYDKIGGKGKTTLARHLLIKYPDKGIYLTGKCSDCKFGLVSHLEKHKTIHFIIFDFTRSIEEYVSYTAIEEIKNGIFFNTKYESKMCLFNPPHVIIFSNFKPDTEALSSDRWVITNVNKISEHV